ncbi:glycosyltransferase family 4 protein [Rothia uropygialis]|uniref:glycosyltransferase family 4 protein n=1 Tax=Kocuria sp. 36 TaxID=1415402 RepID=UPI00101BFF5E|nr:glycosyltransferase family 4 protein [Kocuria sp. 36]
MTVSRLLIATNNGDISGGENMMFSLARAVRSMGREVVIVAPTEPGDVLERAFEEGFTRQEIHARSRWQYIFGLACFGMKHRSEWIWCNGLVPSFALGAHRRKVVHLHQIPVGVNALLVRIALRRAASRLVPSHFAADRIPGTRAFHNWVPEIQTGERTLHPSGPVRVGFIGRMSRLKGVVTLGNACRRLLADGNDLELHLGGGRDHVGRNNNDEVELALTKFPESRLFRHGVQPVETFLSMIDVLVVPSQWGEVFGLVAAEAMSARVPLVISDDGGLPEVVGPDYPWTFPSGDVEALEAMLRRAITALAESPECVDSLTAAARNRWQTLYSPAAGLARTREVLRTIDSID